MIEGILQLYQASVKEGLIGLQVLLDRTELRLSTKCAVSVWPVYRRFEEVKIVPISASGVPGDPLTPQDTGPIMTLDAGRYKLGEKCHAVVFHISNDVKDVKDYQHRLETDGYPSPGSLRLSAFGKGLTDFGIERGRLH